MKAQRSCVVNGNAIERFRLRRGMTQLELAKYSGYAARTIRKAEGGGKLRWETIQNIAEALSVAEEKITPEHLLFDATEFAKRIVELITREAHTDTVKDLVNHRTVWICHTVSNHPLGGHWYGVEGAVDWLNCFHLTKTPFLLKEEPVFSSAPDRVSARILCQVNNVSNGCMPLNVHLKFSQSKLDQVEIDMDIAWLTDIGTAIGTQTANSPDWENATLMHPLTN